MKRAALYARVSHAGGDQDPTPQLRALRDYATTQGWRIEGEYIDWASAGHPTERVKWAELREQCRLGRIDVVACWKLDRAYRSALAALAGIEQFRRWGVAVIFTTQAIDTSTSAGRLLLQVLAIVAEMEREHISERTRAGLQVAKANGKRLGRPPGSTDRKRRRRRRPPSPYGPDLLEVQL